MTNVTPYSLENKVIVITGGAQGIGEATGQLCAERGATVVLADLKQEQGEQAAAAIRGQGCQADFVAVDVTDDAQVKALFDTVRQRYGRLDVLVCAAGILLGPYLQPEEFPVDVFEKVIDVNVKGPFLCAKYAAPLLEASGKGVMIVVASGAGVIGPSSSLAYGASKGGANGLGMTLQGHLAPRGIRVNVICPGNIVTDMKMSVEVAKAQREGASVAEALEKARQNYGVPMGVARVIAFMASAEADYLRGTLHTR
ncbi:MAG: SDR family oxidoreductase [Anaerolineae bacterium]|nr:SDR family oxidoreductase [Anaerolineae bacterium]